MPISGTLYIVGTPIGNKNDITLRALQILGEVDVVCAEDTRVTKKLLTLHDIKNKKVFSLNEFADTRQLDEIVRILEDGKSVAFVSDAGTPGISDPGGLLVSHVRQHNIKIVPIPGVSALTTALSVAGIRETPFLFYGFLPQKKGRQKLLDSLISSGETIVFYESPHRFIKLLSELQERESADLIFEIVVARELTKVFEETRIGRPSELLEHYESAPDTIRGEFVLIIKTIHTI